MANTAPEYPKPSASARNDGNDPARPVVETATEARAGVTGHNVRYVLVIGIAAVVLAFAAIYAGFFAV